LLSAGRRVVCLESDQVAGGCVRTDRVGEFLCERGAQNVLEEPGGAVYRLANELGIASEIAVARENGNYIVWDDRLFAMPSQLFRVLSFRGAVRMMRGLVVPNSPRTGDESIAAWARRRLGDEFASRIADPMTCGVYAGDPERLSVDATFPAMHEIENKRRSLIAGAVRAKPARRRVYSFRNGMGALTSTLSERVGAALRTEFTASRITAARNGAYRIEGEPSAVKARNVVIATPAPVAARLLADVDACAARLLDGIRSAPVTSATLAFPVAELEGARPHGYGMIRPWCNGGRLLGCLFSSSAFKGFAPEGTVLLRVLFGGERDPEAAVLCDEELMDIALGELRSILRIRPKAKPLFFHVVRHWPGLPQYEVGHLARVLAIEERLERLRGIYVAGNSYRGLAVSNVVENAELLSTRLLQSRAAA
jgi:oxygen-dependent protoporphyrinogen oxidase